MQNVFSIAKNNTCPPQDEFILLDTNVILDLVGSGRPQWRVNEVQSFLIKLVQNNNIIVTSVKTWEELNIIFENNNLPRDKNQLFNNLSSFQNVDKDIKQLKNDFNSLPNVYSEPIGTINGDIIRHAETNRLKYNLKWGDSVIYTMAKEQEINNIWTGDCDYARIQDNSTNIYLDSNSYSKALRQYNSSVSNNI